ncbi:MAG: hypothetical protein L3J47_10005 [Sulfurovum sp.]|nr:hypothetical protein [Sulfurovum sp.]
MGAMQRNKGSRAERIVVNMLKDAGFDNAARNLSQTRDSGYDITGLEPLAIEVKDHKTPNLSQWWQQTTQNAHGNLIPCLIWHIPNTSRWSVRLPMSTLNSRLSSERVVTMDFEDFIYIAREMVA